MLTVFFAFGAGIGAMAGSIPAITANAGIDAETLGVGLMVSTFTTVAAMSLGGKLARHASHRRVLLSVLPCYGLTLLAYLTSQSELWFYLAILPMGFSVGLTDLFMNAEAVAIEHDMRRPVFTVFHATVSIGVAVMAIAASFISTTAGTWATGLLALAAFAVAWVMVFLFIVPRKPAWGHAARLAGLPNKLPLTLLGLAAGLIIAGETAALMWSAKLLNELAPSLASIAGLGAAFFGLCNASVRFPGDAMRTSFGDMALMTGSLVIAIGGFAALGVVSGFAASVAAFAAVGVGTAMLIPCVFAMAAGFVPENRAGALSFVSLLTAAPRVLAPWVFGLAATGLGMSAAFVMVAAGLAVALALIIILRTQRRMA